MTDGAIECYKLDVACDIPAELLRLQGENEALNRKLVVLKMATALLGVGIGIYLITKTINNATKEKAQRIKQRKAHEGHITSRRYESYFQ